MTNNSLQVPRMDAVLPHYGLTCLIRMETDGLTGVSDNLEHTNLPFTQVPCTQ